MSPLSHIIVLQSIILFCNVLATAVFAISFKLRLFYYTLAFWVSVTLQLLSIAIFEMLAIDITYEALVAFGFFNLISSFIALQIFSQITNRIFNRKAFFTITIPTLIVATIAATIMGLDFKTVAVINAFGICIPSIIWGLSIFINSKKDILKTSIFCLYFLGLFHFLAYPFLRTTEAFALYGITIHSAILIAFSVVLPACLLRIVGKNLQQENVFNQGMVEEEVHDLGAVVIRKDEELERAHKRLLEVTKHAGRAEIITGVLHNVGNVLNSINISIDVVRDIISASPLTKLPATVDLIKTNIHAIPDYLTHHPKGALIPHFLAELSSKYTEESTRLISEMSSLRTNVDHIKNIVGIQQSLSKPSGITEDISLNELIDQAIQINISAIQKNKIHIIKGYENDVNISGDRLLLLQILINLISNAKHALYDSTERLITIHIDSTENNMLQVTVADTGVGITSEQMPNIFRYGYTTRDCGHGYGLHSSYASAESLGGSLKAFSEGRNLGATFILTIPKDQAQVQKAS